MFQLLPCSRCQRTFSVRSEVSDQALLKCPNCGNQFRLGELLDAFYGPWEILENPGIVPTTSPAVGPQTPAGTQELTGAAPATSLAVGTGLDRADAAGAQLTSAQAAEGDVGLSLDGPELELAEEAVGGAGLSLGSGEAKPKTDWSTFKPISHEEFQRLKRADRSPIWSTLQVVLGGAAAIPVSLLLIWHVLGKDVAGAGPAVARYVPWIVPERFRGFQPAEALEDSEPPRIPRRGESGFRNFDDVMPTPASGSEEAAGGTQQDENAADESPVIGTLLENGERSEVSGDELGSQGTPTDNDSAQEPPAAVDQPMVDVFALLNRTKQKVEDWKEVATAKDTVKREAALALFEDLASLGVRLSAIPDTPGAPALVRDKAQEIARALKRQPDLTEVLHHAAKAQLNGNLPRSKEGWVLVCTVGEMLDQGDSWRIMLADPTLLPLDVPRIEIPKSIAPQLTTGQRLLLLGKFIAPPQGEPSTSQSPPTDPAPTENAEPAPPSSETFRASFSYGL